MIVRTLMSLLLPIAAHAADLRGYQIATWFDYDSNGRQLKTETTITIDDKNKTWMTLAPAKNGVTLIGRVVSSAAKTIDIEFVVIDTHLPGVVVVSPEIKAIIGEKANLVIKRPRDEKITISLLAVPFSLKK